MEGEMKGLLNAKVPLLKSMASQRGVSLAGVLEKGDIVRKLESSGGAQFETTFLKSGLTCKILDNDPVADQVCLLLHGYGSNNADLAAFAKLQALPRLSLAKKKVRFVCPNAPISMGGESRSWFDIMSILGQINPNSLHNVVNLEPDGLDSSSKKLGALVDEIVEAESSFRPFNRSNVILAGFSQGACMSLDTVIMQNKKDDPFGGLFLFSGLFMRKNKLQEALKIWSPPKTVFASHGQQDVVVPLVMGQVVRDLLRPIMTDFKYVEFEGGHTIPPEAIEAFTKFFV